MPQFSSEMEPPAKKPGTLSSPGFFAEDGLAVTTFAAQNAWLPWPLSRHGRRNGAQTAAFPEG
jgi:hypothetical protein